MSEFYMVAWMQGSISGFVKPDNSEPGGERFDNRMKAKMFARELAAKHADKTFFVMKSVFKVSAHVALESVDFA